MSAGRVLLFGCGYLGTRIAPAMRANGWHVTATTTSKSRVEELSDIADHVQVCDVDSMSADSFPSRFDAVIYAVSAGRGRDPEVCYVDGPAKLQRCLEQHPPERFVLVSSTGVYSQCDGSHVDETSAAESNSRNHGHILRGEHAALSGQPAATIVRLGGLYGPDRHPVDWLRRDSFRQRLKASACGVMNWIHIDDAAQAIIAATERGQVGRIYLGVDGHHVTREELYSKAAELAGVEAPDLPKDEGDLGKRCSNRRLVEELDVQLQHPSILESLESLV